MSARRERPSHRRRGLPPLWRMAFIFVLIATAPVVVAIRFGVVAGFVSAFGLAAAVVLVEALTSLACRRFDRRYRRLSQPALSNRFLASSFTADPDAFLGRLTATQHAAAGHSPDPWAHVRNRDD